MQPSLLKQTGIFLVTLLAVFPPLHRTYDHQSQPVDLLSWGYSTITRLIFQKENSRDYCFKKLNYNILGKYVMYLLQIRVLEH